MACLTRGNPSADAVSTVLPRTTSRSLVLAALAALFAVLVTGCSVPGVKHTTSTSGSKGSKGSNGPLSGSVLVVHGKVVQGEGAGGAAKPTSSSVSSKRSSRA